VSTQGIRQRVTRRGPNGRAPDDRAAVWRRRRPRRLAEAKGEANAKIDGSWGHYLFER